jgi:hypothetical protein
MAAKVINFESQQKCKVSKRNKRVVSLITILYYYFKFKKKPNQSEIHYSLEVENTLFLIDFSNEETIIVI